MATRYRNELKYVCTEPQLQIIENNIKSLCRVDTHAGKDGTYLIRSAYFDDMWDTCYRENETGIDPREKFRLRVYNGSLDRISLEGKIKSHEMAYKESTLVTKEDVTNMIQCQYRYYGNNALLNKFFLNSQLKRLSLKVVVEYNRTPYIYHDGNVRITFDRNLCASFNIRNFWEEADFKIPALPLGTQILEIKYDEFLPEFLKNLIQTDGLQQVPYSKYYNCRRIGLEHGYERIN